MTCMLARFLKAKATRSIPSSKQLEYELRLEQPYNQKIISTKLDEINGLRRLSSPSSRRSRRSGCRHSLIQREANGHGGALPEPIARHRDGSPMRLNYCPRNGQAQAGTAYAQAARPVGAVESVEDMGKVGCVYAYPVIND